LSIEFDIRTDTSGGARGSLPHEIDKNMSRTCEGFELVEETTLTVKKAGI